MGVRGLNGIIKNKAKEAIRIVNLEEYKGKTVAIDGNLYLYKFLSNHGNMIDGLFLMINKLKKFKIIPVFVFDGKAPDEKSDTIAERKEQKELFEKEIEELEEEKLRIIDIERIKEIEIKIYELRGKLIYLTKELIEKAKELLDLMGVIYIRGNGEAEQICVKLVKMGLADLVISDDMDVIPLGSKKVLRDFNLKFDTVREYDVEKIQKGLNLSPKKLINLCILLGTDYNKRQYDYHYDKLLEMAQECADDKLNEIIELEKDKIDRIYDLYNVSRLEIEEIDFVKLICKKGKPDIIKLIEFMTENSFLERHVFYLRIQRMYYNI